LLNHCQGERRGLRVELRDYYALELLKHFQRRFSMDNKKDMVTFRRYRYKEYEAVLFLKEFNSWLYSPFIYKLKYLIISSPLIPP